MSVGLIARKIGMTQVFDEIGNVIPVTVVEAGPCYVLAEKTIEKDGYESVLLGFMDKFKRVRRSEKGFYDKIKTFPKKVTEEFRIEGESGYKVGEQVKVDIFAKGDLVDVRGKTKGRGFQGAIKRHGFHKGPMSHGSRYHRRPGSMGACADPSKVFKGKKLPGQMGMANRTIQNLKVIDVRAEDNLILIQGAIPGPNDNIIQISKAIKKKG